MLLNFVEVLHAFLELTPSVMCLISHSPFRLTPDAIATNKKPGSCPVEVAKGVDHMPALPNALNAQKPPKPHNPSPTVPAAQETRRVPEPHWRCDQ